MLKSFNVILLNEIKHGGQTMIKSIIKGCGLLSLMVIVTLTLTQISNIIIPISPPISSAKIALSKMGIKSEKLASSYDMATNSTGISQEMLIALTYTESNFKQKAVSSKNYKGLMQIPYPLWHSDTNILVGAHILNEKIRISNGDIRKAIALYKGYGNTAKGLQKADEVLILYNKLKDV